MKGFGIEIKNNLLDPKHVKGMGMAVWAYMWLIDHITSITEDGFGIVLGGRPVKYDEVKKELGISADTWTRWVDILAAYPYIVTLRTPYGISFKVYKAFKRFKNRIRTNAESASATLRNPNRTNAESNKTVIPTVLPFTLNSKTLGAENPPQGLGRKNKTFPGKDYEVVIDHYCKVRGIELKGDEYLPVKQAVKTMFLNDRTVQQILNAIDVCADNYPEDWTMDTVKRKIPDVVAGVLVNKIKAKAGGVVVTSVQNL